MTQAQKPEDLERVGFELMCMADNLHFIGVAHDPD